jgi:uncharacterized protein YgiM (DUF1202 family)
MAILVSLVPLVAAACGGASSEGDAASSEGALGQCARARVTTTLNLRAQPSADAAVVETMAVGTALDVLAQDDQGWANVRDGAGGKEGWAKATYLACDDAARPTLHARRAPIGAIAIDGTIDPFWADAPSSTFDTAWNGTHTGTSTTVRAAWSDDGLTMLWELDGAYLNVDASRPVDEERTNLYEEDCVEMFLAPDPAERRRYFEIEVGPLGHFFDLLVDRRNGTSDASWSSHPTIATKVDRDAHHVTIEAAFRAPDVVAALRAGAKLPVGLFRMEGRSPRQYLAWSPTMTPKPNFHVPDAFGTLVLDPAP